MYSMQFAGEAFSPNLQSALRIAWPSGLSSGKLNMYKLEMCLGSVADIARGWVYDDGVVVSVSSAQNYLERIRAEFGTDCLALLRFDPLDQAVVVIEGEPDSLMDRTSELLSPIGPDGLPYSDCRSTSMKRKLARAMGYDGLDFPDDDHCLIPRPAVKEQVIPNDGEAVARARRILAKMFKPKAVLNRGRKNSQ